MAGEWHPHKFGTLMLVPSRNGVHKGPAFQGRGVPVVKMGEVFHADLIGDLPRDLLDLTPEELDRLETQAGDLLFCRTSLVAEGVGHCALVGNLSQRSTFASNLIRVRLNPELADPRYWFYYFRSASGIDQILSLARGTSVTTITGPDIAALDVLVPQAREQRAIAHILGTLDDKIELNRRMNETLEGMARALFKSWFVNFDPVRAKAEGRDPGLPPPLAVLFPDSFEDSELGEIPRGWTVGPILNHARLMSGGTPKTDRPEYWDGPISWASAKDVSQANGSILVDTERAITPRGLAESAAQMIPAFSSVVVARGATTGRMVLFGRDMAMNQTCYALATTTKAPFALYCRLSVAIDALVHAAHGSVFDTITTSTFASSRIVLPAQPILAAFEERVAPVFQRVLGSICESRTLATLRDTLLPKLISGELRVRSRA